MPDTAPLDESLLLVGEVVSYWLYSKDTIIKVSQTWNRFALSNNATAEILEESVIGKNTYSFIVDDPTRMYLQVLLQQPRLLRTTVAKKYRCDSPGLKRYMEMRLTPEPEGLVRLDHTLEQLEPFNRPLTFHPASASSRATVCRCSICARLCIGSCWIIPEEAEAEGLIQPDALVPVTYLVCPVCQTF